jgi:hypothetical protein
MKVSATGAMVMALVSAAATQAQTVTIFQTGFEPTQGYIAGNLAGQNSWSTYLGEDPNFGKVVSTGALSGSQSVLLDGTDVKHGTFGNAAAVVHSAVIAPSVAGVPLRYVETTGLCKIVDPTVIASHDSVWLVYYWSTAAPFTSVGAGIVNGQYRFGVPLSSSLSIPAQPGVTFQFRHLLDYQTGIARAWMNGQLAFQTSSNAQFNPELYASAVHLAGSSSHLPCDTRAWYDDLQIKVVYGCETDINIDFAVDVDDLIAVILGWGPCGKSCPADTDNNGAVDVDDLVAVILNWGPC